MMFKILLDHVTSAVILGLSFLGRWYAPKINVTRMPFTLSILSTLLLLRNVSGARFLLFKYSHERKEIRLHFR